MTDDDLRAIAARLEAITPGEWIADDGGGISVYDPDDEVHNPVVSYVRSTPDAEFIANAPGDIRALLAQVDLLTAQRDAQAKFYAKTKQELDATVNSYDQVRETVDAQASELRDMATVRDELYAALWGKDERIAALEAALREARAIVAKHPSDDYMCDLCAARFMARIDRALDD